MSIFQRIICVLLLFFLISACSSTVNSTLQPSVTAADPKTPVPTPNPETATVTGRVVSATSGHPFSNEYVALAEVHKNEEGVAAFGLNTRSSPQTTSDADGNFIFTDIPAREYVVIVGDPMVRSIVLNDLSTGNAKVWDVKVDQILDMGELEFEFNTP